MEHFKTIHHSPSHIYHSALLLCPISSWLHEFYSADLPLEIKVVKGLPVKWGAHSHTILPGCTTALVCWKDLIAVGLTYDIKIFYTATGICTSTLSGHTGSVNSLAISLDGTLFGSGSHDYTIKLWDIQTGGVVKTFHYSVDHNSFYALCAGPISSLSISPDCIMIASLMEQFIYGISRQGTAIMLWMGTKMK